MFCTRYEGSLTLIFSKVWSQFQWFWCSPKMLTGSFHQKRSVCIEPAKLQLFLRNNIFPHQRWKNYLYYPQISLLHKYLSFLQFKCDANLKGRTIPYDNARLINLSSKSIRGDVYCILPITVHVHNLSYSWNLLLGRQFRTMICKWGGKSCFGISNQIEKQDFCDEPDVMHYFNNRGFFWSYDHPFHYEGRKFMWADLNEKVIFVLTKPF